MRAPRRLLLAALLAVPALLALAGTAGAAVYFMQSTSTIARANIDGSNKASVLTGQFSLAGLAITDTHMYFTLNSNPPNGQVRRARLDGTELETLVTGLSNPQSIAVDDEWVYYGQSGGGNRIGRVRHDGTDNNPDFITGVTNPSGLAVNDTHLFWTSSLSSTTGNIGRANVDGTGVNLAFIDGSVAGRGLSGPAGIAVSSTHIFWANLSGAGSGNPQNVRWATITGTHLGVLATGTHFPRSVAIDGTYAYWSNALLSGTTYGRVKITDTTDVDQTFIDGINGNAPYGIAVDSTRGTTTSFTCTPVDPRATREVDCTATVTDNETGTKSDPEGTVNVSDGTGELDGSCTLVQQTATTASCELSYTPAAEGPLTIAGIFRGNATHAPSRGTQALTVGPAPNPTTTALSCTPDTFEATLATTCTVTVTDTGTTPSVPTGDVGFATDADGDFEPDELCTLEAAGADSASCEIEYVPDVEGPHVVSATYGGDEPHAGSGGTAPLTILPPPFDPRRDTTVAVACTPSNPRLTRGTNCMVSVTDVDTGEKSAPAGTIEFDDGRPGTDPTCTLAAQGAGESRCGVSYTPAAVGSVTLEASYDGSVDHEDNEGEATITVGPEPNSTQASVTCSPDVVRATEATICTVSVTDVEDDGALTPTGEVEFASDVEGAFHPEAACSLAPAGQDRAACSVVWIPSAQGENLIGVFYAGDEPHRGDTNTVTITVQSPPEPPPPDPTPPPPFDPIVTPTPPPANTFKQARPALNRRKGTATLRLTLPAAGRVVLTGKGVRRVSRRLNADGAVQLTVRATGKALRKLRRRGRVKVKVRTAFTPYGGTVRSRTTTLTLQLQPKESSSR